MVIRGTRTAAAARLLIAARTAAAAVVERTEPMKHLILRPDLVERRLAHIAQLTIQIRAWLHLAARADDAVREPCQTPARKARRNAELVSDA